ncbi:MAG: metal-dependent transcriptional regulator [Phototrophicaceae bacterium]
MPSERPSESVENFVKAVYVLQNNLGDSDDVRVSTNALKAALAISAPSVTDMAQRLVDEGFVDYIKYRGVRLTTKGETLALNLIRRHRLIELYLVRELNYELHEVHEEAEILEHSVSDRFIEAINTKLGEPEFDPHGDPIPNADGAFVRRDLQALSDLPIDTKGRISRLISTDSAMLQHTLDRGFILDEPIEIIARDPFQGPITVRLGNSETMIGFTVAETILVDVYEN